MNDDKDSNFELNTLGVKDLTLKQLQSLQTYHSSVEEFGPHDWRTDPTAANADEPEESLPFPTLEKLMHALDPRVGLNLEIKYPQFIDVGDNIIENESEHFYDRNNYLDTILETILEHSGDRRIIISCFDSDACIMLKKKQCVFPVIFLTQGQTQKYPPYKDFRTLSIPAAIKFARAEQLVGISVHSEDLLREPSWIAETKHAGLALFCWGNDNDKLDNVQYLRSQGVDGIIYNRINELIPAEKKAAAAAIAAKNQKGGSNGAQRLRATGTTGGGGGCTSNVSSLQGVNRQPKGSRISGHKGSAKLSSGTGGSAFHKLSEVSGGGGGGGKSPAAPTPTGRNHHRHHGSSAVPSVAAAAAADHNRGSYNVVASTASKMTNASLNPATAPVLRGSTWSASHDQHYHTEPRTYLRGSRATVDSRQQQQHQQQHQQQRGPGGDAGGH